MESIVVIKVVSALVYPVGLVFSCAIIGLFLGLLGLRKLKVLWVLLGVSCLLVFSNPMVAKLLTYNLEQQYPQQTIDDIANHDAVIVLGGGLRLPLPPAQHTQIGSGSDRYWYAVQLYRAGKAKRIILSGGNVYAQAGLQGEAYYASTLLQQWGVPVTDILLESGSRTTLQNMRNTADLIAHHDIQSALLVTSAIHMPRAYELFNKLSIPITPASADILIRQQYAPSIFAWIPSAGALMLSTVALHEYYGMWFAELNALIFKR